jgi:RNA polymerase sigma-70 factor (ECF subfamily)
MSDVQRFEAFLRAHQDKVYATAIRLVGRASDAEDIAQTTFLRAWERFPALGDHPAAGGWLTTVATNLALNHLSRHRSRWRLFSELSGDDPGRPDFAASIAAEDTAGDPLARADANVQLERALRALPPHQRVPLVLFHFDDQSYDQIAARLRVSVGKIKTDIHRGRLALRAVLVHTRLGAPATERSEKAAGAERGTGAPASDGERGSGGTKSPGRS